MNPINLETPPGPRLPLIISSAHSGRFYPPEFLRQSRLDLSDLRRLEDCFVDELWRFAVARGASLISLHPARAYIDVNRDPLELDADMFEAPLPVRANISPRSRAGLGSIPKLAGAALEIYGDKIPFTDALRRIDTIHRPFHKALKNLIQTAQKQHGNCLLLDCHSMPEQPSLRGIDVVLGDKFGKTCSPETMRLVEEAFQSAGFRTRRNDPYAGGYIVETHGQICDAVQIEIHRGLYMNEDDFSKNTRFGETAARLEKTFAYLAESLQPQALAAE